MVNLITRINLIGPQGADIWLNVILGVLGYFWMRLLFESVD